jgi:ATP adenylyltransferase/5',5'''-P-1,P-4-tetraphosphate phosphorylase II
MDNQNNQYDYSYIMTKDWMFMVNRRKPDYHGLISNSLGYIGQFYVVDEKQKD